MKKQLIFVTLLSLLLSNALFSQQKSDWESASLLYARGEYSQALELYSKIEAEGYTSWQLLYNIANCHFKQSNYGKAILYYERSLKLNPSSQDTRYNLQFAKQHIVDKIDEIPDFILKTWIKEINYLYSSDVWAVASLIFLATTLLLLLGFKFGRSLFRRKAAFFGALFSLLLFSLSFSFALNQRGDYKRSTGAVVMVPVSTVRNSPDLSGNTLFILHEGTKLKSLETMGKWQKIQLGDGRQGWISMADIEMI